MIYVGRGDRGPILRANCRDGSADTQVCACLIHDCRKANAFRIGLQVLALEKRLDQILNNETVGWAAPSRPCRLQNPTVSRIRAGRKSSRDRQTPNAPRIRRALKIRYGPKLRHERNHAGQRQLAKAPRPSEPRASASWHHFTPDSFHRHPVCPRAPEA